MVANIRSLTRQFWVNVNLPPTDEQPAHAKGKTPTTDLTTAHLRRRKIEALRLSLSFAFATKHYLRGEDGVNHADYHGVLPASFARFDEVGYNTQKTLASGTYAATYTSESSSGTSSPGGSKPDATKRVRAKRSKQQILDHTTPLLAGTHRSVEFHPFADEASLPLPLMCATTLCSNQ